MKFGSFFVGYIEFSLKNKEIFYLIKYLINKYLIIN